MMTKTISEIITITNSTKTAAATVSSDRKAVEKKTDCIFLLSHREHDTHIRHPPPLPSQFPCPADVTGAAPEAGDCEVFPSPELLCLPVSKPNGEIIQKNVP